MQRKPAGVKTPVINKYDMAGHDRLHLFPAGHPAHKGYLDNCWCMCQRCWRSGTTTKNSKKIGMCICSECPCNRGV